MNKTGLLLNPFQKLISGSNSNVFLLHFKKMKFEISHFVQYDNQLVTNVGEVG
jgi:hypothetical protein